MLRPQSPPPMAGLEDDAPAYVPAGIHPSLTIIQQHHHQQYTQHGQALTAASSFDAFSHHFHLPLKAAAEQFGVRATAFKKRCRAIGIRHWPYRKVRSLKRSLQELGRCREQGELNDKQQYQYAAFRKQLDTLMAPETYGIDPSGRLAPHPFDDGDDDDSDDDGSDSAFSSPRGLAQGFPECSLSPADGSKMFGDFASAPAHLRSFRRQTAMYHHGSPQFARAVNTSLFAKDAAFAGYYAPTPASAALTAGTATKLPFGWPDYLSDETALSRVDTSTGYAYPSSGDDDAEDEDSRGSSPSSYRPNQPAGSTGEYFLSEIKFEEVRPLQDATVADAFAEPTGGHVDYSSDRFFDDVFLQISPDYGCLV